MVLLLSYTVRPRLQCELAERRLQAKLVERLPEPFSALGKVEQQTLTIAARLAEPAGALFNVDVERKAVLKRGIDVLDTKHRCEGAPFSIFRPCAQILTRRWWSQGSCPVRCVGCGRGTATSWTR